MNFDFWRTRADAEQTPDGIAARQAIYQADQAYAKGQLIRARPLYDEGFASWRKVLNQFPILVEDVNLGGDLMDDIRRYQRCLGQDSQQLPKKFILQDIIDRHGKR